MKNIGLKALILTAILSGAAHLPAAESWEGTDDFSSAPSTAGRWKPMGKSKKAYQYVAEGQLRCSFNNEQSDQWWIWGKSIHKIPTAANWSVSAEVQLPQSRPSGSTPDRCKAGLALGNLSSGKQVIFVKMRRYFDANTYVIETDADFASGKDDEDSDYTRFYDRYLLRFTHDALRQQDSLEVQGQDGANPPETLLNPTFRSQLSTCSQVGLAAVVSGKPYWPLNNTTLGLDNWAVEQNNPDPIDLNVRSSSSKGVAYSVAVTGLDLVSQKLTGTVALTVGTASASLPISGTIDRNGYFVLTAKGTGSNKGFGCTLLYDVVTGTFRPNKNSVTAPSQKAIRF